MYAPPIFSKLYQSTILLLTTLESVKVFKQNDYFILECFKKLFYSLKHWKNNKIYNYIRSITISKYESLLNGLLIFLIKSVKFYNFSKIQRVKWSFNIFKDKIINHFI